MQQVSTNHNQLAYSVSEISNALKRLVEDSFSSVRVRGEITGWKIATSGHVYFSLKDENSLISAVCWKGVAGKLPFKPEDGLEVICSGKITTYAGRSNYQLIVDFMEVSGSGALMALLEKRKAQLAKEGLFDEKRKKPLPFLPQTIGVVTSPTGAVIRDILHRLSERFPCRVIIWGVPVQGEGAAEKIANAINGFNLLSVENRPDLIIVARGGGSLEDLWAFNEEVVIRAVAASQIPLISAVGHETDTTLIDYASDKRAPTPTAAAEIAVPVRDEFLLTVLECEKRLLVAEMRNINFRQDKIIGLSRGLPNPLRMLDNATQRLDDWSERLSACLLVYIGKKAQILAVLEAKLQPRSFVQNLQRAEQDLQRLIERIERNFALKTKDYEQQINNLAQLLESCSVKKVLERGFAIVRGEQGNVITRVAQISGNKKLELEFADGVKRIALS